MHPQRDSLFHLIVEHATTGSDTRGPAAGRQLAERGYTPLPLPNAVSFLREPPDGEPYIMTDRPEALTRAVVLEPVIMRDGQGRLSLFNPGESRLRVNAEAAPRVVLLRERDQFQFDDSCVFHVTIFHRPQTGPAPADKVGKPCPICLAPFTDEPNSVCYRCQCGTVLHLKDPSGLECAQAVHDCPHCHQPVALKEGYTWLPKLDS